MKRNHCFVKWPVARGEKLLLHCNVAPNHPQAYAMVQGWTEKCSDAMNKELENLTFSKIEVLQEISKPLRAKVESSIKPTNAEMLTHWEDKGPVYMCGFKTHVNKYMAALNRFKVELEAELEKSKRQITETIELKPHQLALMKLIDLESQYGKDVDIKLSAKNIILVGQAVDVRDVKLKILQKASSIVSNVNTKPSPSLHRLLSKEPVREHLQKLLADKKLPVSFECHAVEMIIYGFEQNDVDSAAGLIKDEIKTRQYKKDSAMDSCIRSQKWTDLENSLPKDFKMSDILTDASSIVIAAVKDQFDGLCRRVDEFIDKNAVIEDFVPMRSGALEVLKNNSESDIERIQSDLKQFKVKISLDTSPGHTGYRLSATKGGIHAAKESMKSLADRVKTRDHKIKEPAHVKYLNENRHIIPGIASRYGVVVKFSDDKKSDSGSGGGGVIVHSKAVVGSSKVLQLVIGNIVKCPADVVVNAANSRLQHGAGVAGAISKAGKYSLICFENYYELKEP